MHRIVIVGGGAGGLELATRLGNRLGARQTAQIVLVDRNPTHLWKPLLHEVAAGSMDPFMHQLEYAAQAHWHHFKFQLGALSGLNRVAKTITLAAVNDLDGSELLPSRELAYDTLVIAIAAPRIFLGWQVLSNTRRRWILQRKHKRAIVVYLLHVCALMQTQVVLTHGRGSKLRLLAEAQLALNYRLNCVKPPKY